MSAEKYSSRYAASPVQSAEDRLQAWQDVDAAMTNTFGRDMYAEGSHGGEILYVSNGTPPEPQEVDTDGPGMSAARRARIARARREIEIHKQHCRFTDAMETAQSRFNSDDVATLQGLSEGLFQ